MEPFKADRPFVWDEMDPDFTFVTETRTVTREHMVGFCHATGIEGRLFTDPEYAEASGYQRSPVPGSFVFTTAEGLVLGTGAYSGSGVGFLGAEMSVSGPTYVGDVLRAFVSTMEIRPTSKDNRAVVRDRVRVVQQDGHEVLVYWPIRLMRSAAEYADVVASKQGA